MKVISLNEKSEESFEEFIQEILDNEEIVRPGLFIGFDEDNDPAILLSSMSWKELIYIQYCLRQYIDAAWNGWEEE